MKKQTLLLLNFIAFYPAILLSQIPTDYTWVKKAGSSLTEIGYGIATDRDSNVLVTGFFKSTATFGTDTITSNGQKDAFVAKYDAGGSYKWVRKIGDNVDDMGNGIATDINKNVYVVGRFSNNITIDGTVNLTNNGGVDIFLAKYDSLGNIVRGKSIGGANADNAEDIVIDNNGDIIITGSFFLTVDFGGQSLTSDGGFDVFVAKYDTAFNLIWAIKGGGTSGDESKSIAVDISNNVFITGYFSGTASFGGTNLTSTGNFDVFVVKYNSLGVTQWARKGNGTGSAQEWGYGIAADRFGNCVAVGIYSGTSITFNSTTGSQTVNSNNTANIWEIFVARYSDTGTLKNLKSFGGSGYDYTYEVDVDYNGEIVLTGGFNGTVNFDATSLTSTNAGTEDLFVLKLDTSCTGIWVLKAGSTSNYVWGEGITIDKTGNVLVIGTYEGNATFGTTNLTSAGGDESYGEDLFIAKVYQNAQWQNPALNISVTSTNITCNGAGDGFIDLTAQGGSAPYTYVWSTGATTQDVSSLAAGAYTVTVKDNSGNIKDTSLVITEPTVLGVTSSITNSSCPGKCEGTANLSASGGTVAYIYKWSNGATSQNISSLCAGAYTGTVIDANGCKITAAIVITEPTAITASITSTDESCIGLCDGSADLTVSGGTIPYTYQWSNGVTTQDQIGALCSGTYTITVIDGNSCMTTSVVTISSLAASIVGSNISCNGLCNGSVDFTVTGGSGAYTYSWSNGATTEDLTASLCSGTYTATVKDANNCVVSTAVIITEPTAITNTIVSTNAKCNGICDGSADLTPGGGTGAYTYNWSNGVTTQNQTGTLCAGTYTATVKDANNCLTTSSVTITEPATVLTVTITSSNVNCFGNCSGSADLTPSGGTATYTYSWSNGITTQDQTGTLCAGIYTATTKDANNCAIVSSVTIVEPTALVVNIDTITKESVVGACDGAFSISVSGATVPYSYSWSSGAITQDLTSLCNGIYTVTVTDANACTKILSDTVKLATSLGKEIDIMNKIKLYPIPTNGVLNIETDNVKVESICVFNLIGKQILYSNHKVQNNQKQNIIIDISNKPAGFYFIQIKTEHELITRKVSLIQ